MSIDKHKLLIRGGVAIVAVGMAVSTPAAVSENWLAVLSYLSITAAGLMMVITGVSQRNAAEGRANHAEVMEAQTVIREQLEAQAEETARLRPLVELVNRHQLQLAEQDARIAELEQWRAAVDAALRVQDRGDQAPERMEQIAHDAATRALRDLFTALQEAARKRGAAGWLPTDTAWMDDVAEAFNLGKRLGNDDRD